MQLHRRREEARSGGMRRALKVGALPSAQHSERKVGKGDRTRRGASALLCETGCRGKVRGRKRKSDDSTQTRT